MTHHPNEGEAEGQRMDADSTTTPNAEIEALTEHVSRWIGAVACDGVLCGPAQQDCRDTITQAMQANASVLTDARAELATAIEERDAMRAELVALRQDADDSAVALAKVTQERDEARKDSETARLAVEELEWQLKHTDLCGDPEYECPLHDAHKDYEHPAIIEPYRQRHPLVAPDEWTTMDAITGPLPTDNT